MRKTQIGDRIGRQYEVRRILEGGMGIVYVCLDLESRNVFALKTFQDKYLTSNEMKGNFKREALAWIHLEKHPNIVRAIFVQELDLRLFIALEFVAPDELKRNTLAHYLKSPISVRQALEWAIQFCSGMEHAASRGVTPHRDIKPDNIMMTQDRILKITDFGLAKLWDGVETISDWREKADGGVPGLAFLSDDVKVVAGTPEWMAPEQFYGGSDVRSDIYSFGIVLYQIANEGKLPFYVQSRKEYRRVHNTEPVPWLDTKLFPIIERCLQKKPENRYPGFRELRTDLEQIFLSETGFAPPSPPSGEEFEAWEHSNKGFSLRNLGLLDDAISECKQAIRIDPEYGVAHNNLGIALKDRGDLVGAISEYRQAVRLNPGYAEAYYNLGSALKDRGDLDKAIGEYRQAIRIKPELAEAHYNLGIALKEKGDLVGAISEYRQAIRLYPELAQTYNNLGNALREIGDLVGAIGEYRQAIRIDPGHASAHNNLGIALGEIGDSKTAISEYRQAIEIDPEFAEAHYNLGIALYVKGDLEEAISECRQAIRLDPERADAHSNLGLALRSKGDLDGAISEYRQAIRIDPKYVEAHVNLGVALRSKGDLDGAIDQYRQAIRIDPGLAVVHFNLGLVLEAKGLNNEAIEVYRNFIKLAPPQYAQYIERAHQRIRGLEGS